MCLLIKSGPHIATKPIVVYKMLQSRDGVNFYSPYQGFKYEGDTEYTSIIMKVPFLSNPGIHEITEGLHAWVSLEVARNTLGLASLPVYQMREIFAMAIPEGAIYYRGRNNDIVSTRLCTGYVSKKWSLK